MAVTDEALLKRVLPHSIEAEQSVIGAMIMDREAITIGSEIMIFMENSMASFLTLWWN